MQKKPLTFESCCTFVIDTGYHSSEILHGVYRSGIGDLLIAVILDISSLNWLGSYHYE